jgi:nucleotide-binding universal stress UspA family protein
MKSESGRTTVKTNILFAVDVAPGFPQARHVEGAIDMIGKLVHTDIDKVIVCHVREFSVPRLARTMRDHGGASGRRVVDEVVARLRGAGIQAGGIIREADTGRIAQTILQAAAEHDARLIVIGARGRTDLPRTPLDAATHLLHISTLPVLVVPSAKETAPAAVRAKTTSIPAVI